MLKRRIQDRISALPDRVLLHILSFLNMKEVVRTSVLSKRWQYTWTSVSTLTFVSKLIFRYHQNYEKTAKFVAWVNKTLLRCRNTIIEKFTVNFTYNDRFVHDVDVWASFAAQKKVRDLSLHLESDLSSSIHMSYSLPQSVCCNSFLMNLSIRGCKVVPKEGLSWTSLKSLSIEDMELNDDTIAKILCGSPMLEYLKITHCEGFNRLDIKSETLRELVIDGYFTMLKDEPLLEISAPNLQSLHILGYLRKFRLMSVPSLLKAELNFSFDGDDEYETQCSYFIKLLESLHHVEELEVGHWCIQLLSVSEVKGFPSPSSCRKCLKLEANIDKIDLPGIISLLKSSPYLEKLVIKSPLITDEDETIHTEIPSCSHFLNRLKKYWSSEERDLNFAFLHLRIVEFNGFTSLEDPRFILKLIQLLLQNAGVLKSILISMREYDEKCSSCLVSPDLLKLAQELLSFERLSPHAKIIFS